MERSEDDGSHCCLVAIGRLQVTNTPNSDHIALVIVLDLYLIVFALVLLQELRWKEVKLLEGTGYKYTKHWPYCLSYSPWSVSHSYFPCFTAGVQRERSENDGSHCCLVAIGRLQVTSTPNSNHIALVIVLDLYLIVISLVLLQEFRGREVKTMAAIVAL